MSQKKSPISDDITILESSIKMPLMRLPVTTPLVKLSTGSVLISPGSALNRDLLKSQESVTDIVANNLFHHAGVPKAASLFSKAKIWGVEGLEKKRSDINWTSFFHKDHWPHHSELPFIQIKGMSKVNEIVFFHVKSKTLIVSDLCFNLQGTKGFGPWLILSLFGTYNKFAVSKFLLKFIDNNEAFKNSLSEILNFEFENLIVGHGNAIQGNARSLFQKALKERNLV